MPPLVSPELEMLLQMAGPKRFGTLISTDGMSAKIAGLAGRARLGDSVTVLTDAGASVRTRIVAIDGEISTAFSYDPLSGVAAGNQATLQRRGGEVFPCEKWIGRTIDPFGEPLDDAPLERGKTPYALEACAPEAVSRKLLGPRLSTGSRVFNTFLPLCQGQRLGLFAGAGVGKSSLLGALAREINCDVVVIALIGERGREVRSFVEETLGPEGKEKAITIVSTSDQSPLAKKRGANLAMATAEYFRDQNKQVLLVFDSLTRFAESHREIALAAGEAPSLHAFPPSTFRSIASLVERAGPGVRGAGDITALFAVLVAGSDMNEPVADMIRGILDGHIVLDRKIAERGRYPAIDISRSVSRSLPGAASDDENVQLTEARSVLRAYEDSEMIVRAGLYAAGSDAATDRALKIWPELDAFISEQEPSGITESFRRLNSILEKADHDPLDEGAAK